MKRLSLRLIIGLLAFAIGLAAFSAWKSQQQPRRWVGPHQAEQNVFPALDHDRPCATSGEAAGAKTSEPQIPPGLATGSFLMSLPLAVKILIFFIIALVPFAFAFVVLLAWELLTGPRDLGRP